MKITRFLRKRCPRMFQIALAVGLLFTMTSSAPAIVGYVNVVVTNGYNFLVNPLNVFPANRITNVLASVPEGTRVWLWNTTNQTFEPPAIYEFFEYDGWSSNLHLAVGRGFVLHALTKFTNTFVGEVATGTNLNFIVGSNKLTLIGSMIPVGGSLVASPLNFPSGDGDSVLVYPFAQQQYVDSYTFFTGHGWFDPQGAVGTNGPNISVGQSFFVRRRGPNTNWVSILNPLVINQLSTGGGGTAPPPDIVELTIQNGLATLRLDETNRPFNVQFSTDRVFWTTIATNQIGGTWTGTIPSASAGFFQLVSP